MSIQPTENPYTVLGVARDASEIEIKQAYFAKVRDHSPENDPEGFKRIRAAYERLRASKDRLDTDLFLVEYPTFSASAFRRAELPPPDFSLETIKADFIALEAFLLETELAALE